MKRVAIGYSLMVLGAIILVVGIVWIGLYYGGILPIYNSIVGTYGGSIFDTNTITFVLTFTAFWLFVCTLVVLWWLWQQSQKRGLYEG